MCCFCDRRLTTVVATIGATVGKYVGAYLGRYAEVLGGLTLITIGSVILFQHLSA